MRRLASALKGSMFGYSIEDIYYFIINNQLCVGVGLALITGGLFFIGGSIGMRSRRRKQSKAEPAWKDFAMRAGFARIADPDGGMGIMRGAWQGCNVAVRATSEAGWFNMTVTYTTHIQVMMPGLPLWDYNLVSTNTPGVSRGTYHIVTGNVAFDNRYLVQINPPQAASQLLVPNVVGALTQLAAQKAVVKLDANTLEISIVELPSTQQRLSQLLQLCTQITNSIPQRPRR